MYDIDEKERDEQICFAKQTFREDVACIVLATRNDFWAVQKVHLDTLFVGLDYALDRGLDLDDFPTEVYDIKVHADDV